MGHFVMGRFVCELITGKVLHENVCNTGEMTMLLDYCYKGETRYVGPARLAELSVRWPAVPWMRSDWPPFPVQPEVSETRLR
jgi:hypothetical protein